MSATRYNNLPLWVQHRDKFLAHSIETNVEWRYGEAPDYSHSNEYLAKESQRNHPHGSLEALVQNLVRTFDIEANFKINPSQWVSIVNDKFRMSTNGGSSYTVSDLVQSGTYKLLIGNTKHYKADEEDFETSTNLFLSAFPDGFLWEVLDVFSPPPTIAFKWRHWGHFNGKYKDYTPTGETVEVIGMSIVRVTDDLKILSLEHYYDNTKFLDKLTSGGKLAIVEQRIKPATDEQRVTFWGFIKRFWHRGEKPTTGELQTSRCPFSALNSSTVR
jgi:hypothetical protein